MPLVLTVETNAVKRFTKAEQSGVSVTYHGGLPCPPRSRHRLSLELGTKSLTDSDMTDATVRLSLSGGQTETASTVADYIILNRVI